MEKRFFLMILEKLELKNFRNYSNVSLSLNKTFLSKGTSTYT